MILPHLAEVAPTNLGQIDGSRQWEGRLYLDLLKEPEKKQTNKNIFPERGFTHRPIGK